MKDAFTATCALFVFVCKCQSPLCTAVGSTHFFLFFNRYRCVPSSRLTTHTEKAVPDVWYRLVFFFLFSSCVVTFSPLLSPAKQCLLHAVDFLAQPSSSCFSFRPKHGTRWTRPRAGSVTINTNHRSLHSRCRFLYPYTFPAAAALGRCHRNDRQR